MEDGHITRQHFGGDSTGSKIATAIGLLASGLGGEESVARYVGHLQGMIDKDVEDQVRNQEIKKSVFTGFLHQMGNARDAAQMSTLLTSNYYANQLKQAAAMQKEPAAQARLLMASGELMKNNAALLGSMAARRSIAQAGSQGIIPPEHIIRLIVPKEEQAGAIKALNEAQEGYKARDNALDAFDTVAKLQTVGNRAGKPFQSKSIIDSKVKSVTSELSKALAGKFSEFEMEQLMSLWPSLIDDEATIASKRNNMNKLLSQKLNFNELKKWNIDPSASSRYTNSGESKFKTAPPVRR
jgi:hypothetical protein